MPSAASFLAASLSLLRVMALNFHPFTVLMTFTTPPPRAPAAPATAMTLPPTSGVGDEDVEPAEAGPHGAEEVGLRGVGRDVRGEEDGRGVDGGGDGGAHVSAAADEDDAVAEGVEVVGEVGADAALGWISLGLAGGEGRRRDEERVDEPWRR